MNQMHLLVPSEVIKKLSERFVLTHKHGAHGYFVVLTENELWGVVKSLVDSGYRVDISPGEVIKLIARRTI